MSIKKFIILTLAMVFLVPVSLQDVFAAEGSDPNWKQEQDEMFKEIGLKPGDVISKSDYEKVKDVLPEAIVNWVKKGEFTIKIGEFTFDYSTDKQWLEDGKKNEGKYKIREGELNYMVEVATGEVPRWVYGRPFPNVDVKNDPYGPLKMMYNSAADQSRAGSQLNHGASMDWIGKGGYERSTMLEWYKYSFWHRPDGEEPNPKNYCFMELVPVTKPYDSKGIVNMFFRMADGSRDQVYCYIPAIRRVKRLSGANRSDPTLGGDTCQDDAAGWSGDNCSMKWKLLGEQICLTPMTFWAADRARKMLPQPDGSWITQKGEPSTIMGWMDPQSQGAPWELINILWMPRKVWVVEATPLDPYYTYGKTDLYVDKKTLVVTLKTIYNKAMEYWRMAITPQPASDWGDRRSFSTNNFSMGVDDRTHHSTIVVAGGPHRGEPEPTQEFNTPKVNRGLFVPSRLKVWSK